VQQQPVDAGAGGTQRRGVDGLDRQRAPLLVDGDDVQISVERGEQLTGHPGGDPAQLQTHAVIDRARVEQFQTHRLGQSTHIPERPDPGQPDQARRIRIVGHLVETMPPQRRIQPPDRARHRDRQVQRGVDEHEPSTHRDTPPNQGTRSRAFPEDAGPSAPKRPLADPAVIH